MSPRLNAPCSTYTLPSKRKTVMLSGGFTFLSHDDRFSQHRHIDLLRLAVDHLQTDAVVLLDYFG
jgi:hypothetical protein